MNGITASVSLLTHSPLTVEHQEVVQFIETSTQELLHILSKVLDAKAAAKPLSVSSLTLSSDDPSPLTLPTDVPISPRSQETFAKEPYFTPSPSPSPSPSISSPPVPSQPIPTNSSLLISSRPPSPVMTTTKSQPAESQQQTGNPLKHSISSPSLGSSHKTTPFTEISTLFPRLLQILVVDDNDINRRVLERMIVSITFHLFTFIYFIHFYSFCYILFIFYVY